MDAGLIALIVVAVFLFIVAARAIRIVPQARAGIVERLGRYKNTLDPGLALIIPFIDRVKPLLDLREQVVSFPPQPVITEDNLVVGIDTVIYFTITDAKAVTYEVANPLQAIEQLTVTTLRNVIGGLTLEETLTSRDNVNSQLRVVLDEATGRWGIRVNRVELKSVEPPRTVQEAMEKQMRAERDRRATILTAEGVKQSAILTAEGEKQSAVLKAEGARTAAILRAEGEAKAIETVFQAIHDGAPDERLLSYQYLQMLPQLAQGQANKVFVIPSEFTQALGNLTQGLADNLPKPRPKRQETEEAREAAAADVEEAAAAARAGGRGGPRRPAARPARASSTPDAVHRVERGDLVGLGERRVVEDGGDEEVDRRVAAHHGLPDVDEVGGARADHVHAEQAAVVGVDEQLEHAVLVAAHQPAGELAPAGDAGDVRDRRVGQLLLGLADHGDLGHRVDAGRDQLGQRLHRLAERVQGGDAALLHGRGGQPAARDVADGEDVRHGRAVVLVDRDAPARRRPPGRPFSSWRCSVSPWRPTA